MHFRTKLNFLIIITICCLALLQCTGGTPGGGFATGGGALDGGPVGGNTASPGGQPVEDFTPKGLPEYVKFKVLKLSQVQPGGPVQWEGMEVLQVAPENPQVDEDGPLVVDAGKLPTQVDPGEYAYGPKPYVWYRHQDNPNLSSWAFQTDEYGYKTMLIGYPKSEGNCEHHFTFHACWLDGEGKVWEAQAVSASCPEGKYDDPFEVTLELIPSQGEIECPPPNPS
ncbi:MAG: hypothetical protein R3257_05405 [bacterium]|nr:hypothetical protein [bacterium]